MEIDEGRYRLIRRLGEGGTGTVYQAADLLLGRTVAVKVLHRPFGADLLFREAQSLACLSHPNVVAVYDVVEAEKRACLVMEYVDGCSLESLLQERGRLPLQRALAIFGAVASAVRAAHARGVLHCDLKPANVLLATSGEVKLSDFTLAHRLLDGSYAGTAGGSPSYAAPEQLRGEALDPRCDIYGLGALLQRMVEPADLALPEGRTVVAALDRALAYDPADRFALVDDFLAALPGEEGETTRLAPSSITANLTRVAPGSSQPEAPRRRWPLAAIPAALVLLAAALYTHPPVQASPSQVAVPDVVSTQSITAERVLHSVGLRYRVTSAYSSTVSQGLVMLQQPRTGSRVEPRGIVRLVVSKGPQPVPVPNLQGLSQDAATVLLKRAGLQVSIQTSDTITGPTGVVVGQDPNAAAQRLPGATVIITVSTHPWWWIF